MAASAPVVREAARVLVLRSSGELLVLRGHDPDNPQRSWWFTPGGGLHAGESPRQGAVRELLEETGYVVETSALIGPVWERTARFDFLRQPFVQHEVFFIAHVDDALETAPLTWTATEHEMLDGVAWMTPHDLRETDIEVFPRELAHLVEQLPNWDGTLVHLGEEVS